MSRPVSRYRTSPRYLAFTLFAAAGTALSIWSALHWHTPSWHGLSWNWVAWIASAGFAASALAMFFLALRPAIEIHESHLKVGRRSIPWTEIRRVDQTGWNSPLAVQLTMAAGQSYMILYPGDIESSASLLRQLRRLSRHARLDGITYAQFWGETEPLQIAGRASHQAQKQLPPPRYPLLRPEDEEEVERLFQRLKTAGRLDRHSSDED